MKKYIIGGVIILAVVVYYIFDSGKTDIGKDKSSHTTELIKSDIDSQIPAASDAVVKVAPKTESQTVMDIESGKIIGYVYISNLNTTTVSICPLNNQGDLVNCTIAANKFNAPNALALTLDGNALYVANQGLNDVDMCIIDRNDGGIGNCRVMVGEFHGPSAIAIDGNAIYAYIANKDTGTISRCQYDRDNYLLSGCAQIMDKLAAPSDINFSPDNAHVYISNEQSNDILVCTYELDQGFINCQSTGNGLSAPQAVSISTNGKFAYIVNQGSNSVSLCNVNVTDGLLSGCVATGEGFSFNAPSDFTFNAKGSLAYISQMDSVVVCNAVSSGELVNCRQNNGNFNHSTGIRIVNK